MAKEAYSSKNIPRQAYKMQHVASGSFHSHPDIVTKLSSIVDNSNNRSLPINHDPEDRTFCHYTSTTLLLDLEAWSLP